MFVIVAFINLVDIPSCPELDAVTSYSIGFFYPFVKINKNIHHTTKCNCFVYLSINLYDIITASCYISVCTQYGPHKTGNNLTLLERQTRYCEQLWIRTSLYVNYEMFNLVKLKLKIPLPLPKSEYCDKSMQEKQRTFFGVVNKLLHNS